jgi:uncharacterized protein (TIGR03086 family)
MSDAIKIYETVKQQARARIGAVKDDQMGNSTPCSDWDVAALIEHMVKAQTGLAGTVSGGEVAAEGTSLERLDTAAAAMVQAVNTPGGLDKQVKRGDNMVPASQMFSIAIMDLGIHSWDLAKATAQDTAFDADVVEFLFPVAEGLGQRPPSPAFAPPVDAAKRASRQDQIIAMTGRTP